jgi:hypothetical protein
MKTLVAAATGRGSTVALIIKRNKATARQAKTHPLFELWIVSFAKSFLFFDLAEILLLRFVIKADFKFNMVMRGQLWRHPFSAGIDKLRRGRDRLRQTPF